MAEIDTSITLLSKIDKFDDIVYSAALLLNEDGIITICGDRSVRVLLRRDGGHYWPTICEYLAESVLTMAYNAETRRLIVGLANSVIQEFILSEDYNRLSHRRDYLGQVGRIRAICFSNQSDWLFSCGSSPQIMQHCLQSGVLLSTTKLSSWGMNLQLDEAAKFVFVGELNGFVSMYQASQNSLSVVKRVQRHSGCITRMLWDPVTQWLFSSSSDGLVCCWDFGGGSGNVFELRAHNNSVNGLILVEKRILLTCGDDGAMLAWMMDEKTLKKRQIVPKWIEANECQICKLPFFWNVKQIYQNVKANWLKGGNPLTRSQTAEPQVGGFGEISHSNNATHGNNASLPMARQHHCRRCGFAICGNCSNSSSTLPLMGFELPVRICTKCAKQITKEEIKPLCSTRPFGTGHAVVYMDWRPSNKQLLTVGRDRVVKIWDAQNLLRFKNSDY